MDSTEEISQPEQEIKAEEKSITQDTAQQKSTEETSGGWWWSKATQMVSSSVEGYIKPTMTTLSSTTSQFVKEFLDDQPAAQNENSATPDSNEEKKEETVKLNEDFFTTVDKGFTMIGDSVDVLGNYFNQGLSKVMENTAGIQHKAKDLAKNSLTVGSKIATQSIDALEEIGKTAVELLTVQEQNRMRLGNSKYQGSGLEETLKKNYFDENNGNAYLQALEKLSIEATMRIQKLEAESPGSIQIEKLQELVTQLKNIFDESEEITDDIKVSLSEKIVSLFKEKEGKVNSILESYKSDLKEISNPEAIKEVNGTVNDIYQLTASYLDKILLECVRSLSHYSAAGIEELLRFTENILSESESSPLSMEDAKKKSFILFRLSQTLSDELTRLSNTFTSTIQSVCETAKNSLDSLDKSDETKEIIDDIETKGNLHTNHIYLDTTNAASNIIDSRQFLFPICKSLFYVKKSS